MVEEEIWRKERENGRPVHEPFEVRKVQNQCEWFLVSERSKGAKCRALLSAGKRGKFSKHAQRAR